MFHGGGGGGMTAAAAAAHDGAEQRQRKPEPKRVWLDAIMSKTRQTDAVSSPFASAASAPPFAAASAPFSSGRSGAAQVAMAKTGALAALPSPASLPATATGVSQQLEHWEPSLRGAHFAASGVVQPHPNHLPTAFDAPLRAGVPSEYYPRAAPPLPAAPMALQSSSSSSDIYQEQLELDDSILAETMSLAFKQMVGEQDCCFIAKGICHLCGTNERHLIPVVNFCPEFHVNHSLCREHLRSMHRVRMEDIFAGKNRPTVSKRSLKCSVCSRSCPCSTCQLEKQHEISKYKRWLAGEREYELDSEDRSMGSDQPRAIRNPSLSKKSRSSFGSNTSSDRDRALEYLPNAGQSIRELYGSQRLPPRYADEAQPFPAGVASPHVDIMYDEDYRAAPTLQAGAKPPSHSYRGAKRAAKDVTSGHLPLALNVPGGVSGASFGPYVATPSPPIESPSAAHVLNCAESEKSLVRLLTTLNQEAASSAPAFAEPKDPGALPPPEIGASLSLRSADARNANGEQSRLGRSNGGDDASVPSGNSSNRKPKRKRETRDARELRADSETSSETSATNSRSHDHGKAGGRVGQADPNKKNPVARKAEVPNSTRGSATQRESMPKPSPTAKLSTKGKQQKDVRPRSAPKASPTTTSGRKGNGGDAPGSSDKKSPLPRKGAPASRGSTPKGGTKEAGRSGPKNAGKRQSAREEEENNVDGDDDGEESEIDTNLDYCEVCLAAGDLVCCDVCPRSFHLACLRLKESDLPEGDWQCAECRKPSFFVRYRATVDMKQSVYGKCVEAIRCLKTHPYSKQFLAPVTNIEHYRSIVKQPMDLTTIEVKLKADKYTKPSSGAHGEKNIDIDAFANDVRLVWSNCKLFNDDGSGITRAADELAAGFEDIYHDMVRYVKAASTKSAAKAPNKPSSSSSASGSSSGSSVASTASSTSPAGKKAGGASEAPGSASSSKKAADETKQHAAPASTSSTESENNTGAPSSKTVEPPADSTVTSAPVEKAAADAKPASEAKTAGADAKSRASKESESKKS